ncbi:MAG: hypothetical protein KZQ83_20175 [gamma proteobacterium symbiont of Taylorina sp.]|nr:hypothetical protein [gamma proteobacterium symbiont of Taylorina sp.]
MTYSNALCLRARVFITPENTVTDEDEKKLIVSNCLQEIRDYGLSPMFSNQPHLIDIIIYKLRVILFELVDNAFKHAFDTEKEIFPSRYFGIYARIRKNATNIDGEKLWQLAKSRENTHCPTLKNFNVSNSSDWIDLFYYDPGRGLLDDLSTWTKLASKKLTNDELAVDDKKKQHAIVNILNKALNTTSNHLHRISNLIFSEAVSRYTRNSLTILTGLQHIGLVLSNNRDFARLSVNREWSGSPHPWKKVTASGMINLKKRDKYSKYPDTKGTAWNFCLLLQIHGLELSSDWVSLDFNVRKSIDGTITNTDVLLHKLSNWGWIDERNMGCKSTEIYMQECMEKANFLWLPGDVTKQHVSRWISKICGDIGKQAVNSIKTWIIADIPAYQAGPLAQIIKNVYIHRQNKIKIIIVSNDWRCICLNAGLEFNGRFSFHPEEATIFINNNIENLFSLLRYIDSTIFWKGIPLEPTKPENNDIPFVYEAVDWEGDGTTKATLKGYLDLPQALIEPYRVIACQRALIRTWFLFSPNTICIAADRLLDGLLPEESIQFEYVKLGDKTKIKTIVSSVLVTGGTANRNHQKNNDKVIHLFHHLHVKFTGNKPDFVKEIVVMNWLKKEPKILPCPIDNLSYERIPGTPFIGRGGPKAIPVRRFERPTQEIVAFDNKLSLYGETPEATYDHFSLLGILKLGHWQYGSHHDLLTLNIGKAYALERKYSSGNHA